MKKIVYGIVGIISIFIFTETVMAAGDFHFFGTMSDVVKCGNAELPTPIPTIVRTVVNLIKIATPIILIVMGMVDMVRSVAASDEKKMAEAKGKFVKRLLAGALVFFVVTILQFLIGIVAPEDKDNLLNCIECMVSDGSKCTAVTR